MHTAEPLVNEPIFFGLEIAIGNHIDDILAEMVQTGGNDEIHNLLILFGIRKNCHSGGRESIVVAIGR
jgi:hypothetical protein